MALTGTPKKFWNVWKEQNTVFLGEALAQYVTNRSPTEQDRNLISLFSKERVMELIRYFVIFDANVKKICRYQQYFAIKEIIKTIQQTDEKGNRQSGVIWHTQGSGKSLTMVMLAKYILMELYDCNPKVVVVTDRKELDRQIAGHLCPYPLKSGSSHQRAKSGRATGQWQGGCGYYHHQQVQHRRENGAQKLFAGCISAGGRESPLQTMDCLLQK